MNSNRDAKAPTNTGDRVDRLESTVAHQQHNYDALNQVVIEQAKLLDSLQRRLAKLESTIEDGRHQVPGEPRDLLDEKPPHY